MSSIRLLRLRSDEVELAAWLKRGGSRYVEVLQEGGAPVSSRDLELMVPGVAGLSPDADLHGASRLGPFVLRDAHRIHVEMPADYPFRPPLVRFDDPFFHPNVFPSGKLCWGIAEGDSTWWRGGDGLGILIERILMIATGDPQCVNPKSPANPAAVHPYTAHAALFPLVALSIPGAAAAPRALRFKEAAR